MPVPDSADSSAAAFSAASPPPPLPGQSTGVRHAVVGVTALASLMLYLDRICIAEIAKMDSFKLEMGLTDAQKGGILSAFFFTYALAQVPAGWLSDRLGARTMLPVYIVLWSLCTALTGLATGFAMLMAARLIFGVTQAGCYPTAGSLIRRWVPARSRGTASSVVAFGGRVGGALAPILTAWLLADWLEWRAVLVLYGLSGLLVALLFWRVVRESPDRHPRCNDAERALIAGDRGQEAGDREQEAPPVAGLGSGLLRLAKSPAMWLMGALQFGINFGWVFLVTWLPTYLKEVKHVDPKIGGWMSTLVLLCGVAGIVLGGPLTDFAARRLGLRWGRSLPMIGCYLLAFGSYFACLYLESAWAFIAAVSLVAFATDLSVPAIWAYMQDVGGRHTASAFGWGNMWGNLGAGATTALVPVVLHKWDANGDWHEAFWLFSAGYAVSLLAALGVDARKKVG